MSGSDQGKGSDVLDAQDRQRFEQLVLPHLDAAFNLARWLLRSRADSEDVAQEAMLRAYRFFRGFHGGDARAWATSSESARLFNSHRARLKAASRCGRTSCSKRARSCASNTSAPFPWSEPLMSRNRPNSHFIPNPSLDVTKKAKGS